MAKIYNEVIIDMNPESSSYGETLYEDSYEGEIGIFAFPSHTIGHLPSLSDSPKTAQDEGQTYVVKMDKGSGEMYYKLQYWNNKWLTASTAGGKQEAMDKYGSANVFENMADFGNRPAVRGEQQFGAANLGKADFLDEEGNPLPMNTVIENLVKKFPDKPRSEIESQVRENAPKFQAVPEEEKQFAKEAMKRDVYGISKEARKVGAQARGVYGGTGASMRGAMTGTEDIAKGFEQAQQAYQQDLYGLERGAEQAYEADIAGFVSGWREGGRVPTKEETFLDVLTQLPDAGGS